MENPGSFLQNHSFSPQKLKESTNSPKANRKDKPPVDYNIIHNPYTTPLNKSFNTMYSPESFSIPKNYSPDTFQIPQGFSQPTNSYKNDTKNIIYKNHPPHLNEYNAFHNSQNSLSENFSVRRLLFNEKEGVEPDMWKQETGWGPPNNFQKLHTVADQPLFNSNKRKDRYESNDNQLYHDFYPSKFLHEYREHTTSTRNKNSYSYNSFHSNYRFKKNTNNQDKIEIFTEQAPLLLPTAIGFHSRDYIGNSGTIEPDKCSPIDNFQTPSFPQCYPNFKKSKPNEQSSHLKDSQYNHFSFNDSFTNNPPLYDLEALRKDSFLDNHLRKLPSLQSSSSSRNTDTKNVMSVNNLISFDSPQHKEYSIPALVLSETSPKVSESFDSENNNFNPVIPAKIDLPEQLHSSKTHTDYLLLDTLAEAASIVGDLKSSPESTPEKQSEEENEVEKLTQDDSVRKDDSLEDINWKSLHIPEDAFDEAVNLYDKVKLNKMVQSRRPFRKRTSIIASLLFIICRNRGYPRTFAEICNACKVSKRDIGMYYKLMKKVLEPEMTKASSAKPEEFVRRWCKLLEMPAFVCKAAIKIYYSIDELNLVSGKCPIGVSAACIWVVIWSTRQFDALAKIDFIIPEDTMVNTLGIPILPGVSSSDYYYLEPETTTNTSLTNMKYSIPVDCTQKDVCRVASVAPATLTTVLKIILPKLHLLLPSDFLELFS
ncbi:hypothetical protein BB559_006386 [Furculomyces boomerangus]|uniref:Transcription factor TFIIB cyclin-like domain-containing protein n=2 Tax=Harpellales TaxID=61421 RepID=A0A2T9XZD1_9FUNG|nr:hypothetical protein BB559_007015 [Furculomyces boomerangus]PVU86827.1 hypothetical protein BB559_006386 [Furculomyces boomerangus]PVZ98430.1 hypothetical protein BB558_005564 [Smittium angustum]